MNFADICKAESWRNILGNEFEQAYMLDLQAFLNAEQAEGKIIYPQEGDIFRALEITAFHKVKVVILGQDPYHGEGQAHGLSFSVPPGVKIPPSLRNIFKEITRSLGMSVATNGSLISWAEQGVLLLNAMLTVEKGKAGSHQKKGWERFTDKLIAELNVNRDNIVFMLWGSYAQRKGHMINIDKHCVLTSPHPSPLSAHRGFIGNDHFLQANDYLQNSGQSPIDWST